GRALAALAVSVAVLGLSSATVLAHVEVVRTDPTDGSVLTASPPSITLTFTEDLSLELAHVRLRSASGTEVALAPLTFGPDRHQLLVAVPTLPRDAYRLSYDVRDPIDLHETSGSIVFGVGTTPVVGGGTDANGAKLGESLFGWSARGGLAFIVGGTAMIFLVRRRARHDGVRARFIATSVTVMRVGAVALIVGELAGFITQVIEIGASPLTTARRVLLNSAYGQRLLVSAVLAGGLLRFLHIVRPLLVRRGRSRLGVAELGAGLVAVSLTVVAAFAAHAGIGGSFASGVALRIVHLAASGAWVGGLVVLAVAWRRFGAAACAGVIRSFSLLALVCVTATVITGLLLSGREVTSLTALLSTGFGDVLVFKLALVGIALLLAARHASGLRRGRRLGGRGLIAEAGIALLVVLAGAGLATAAPAVGERFSPATAALETTASSKVDDLLVRLTIGPSRPGRNLVRVEFIDSRRPAPQPPQLVTVEMVDAAGSVLIARGGPPIDGILDLAPVDIVSPGPLRVTVRVDRPSRPVPPVAFDWTVGATPVPRVASVGSNRPLAPFTRFGALFVAVLGALALGRRRRQGARDRSSGRTSPAVDASSQDHGTGRPVEREPDIGRTDGLGPRAVATGVDSR
ncbi:MAG: copper resistance protein CopC, partial [Ilumatobacteraceae bacterium]